MDCDAAREHLDAWALGALDVEDVRALESHLATCADCAKLADTARHDAAEIALAVPLKASSSALKARVMASAAVLTEIKPEGRRSAWRWKAGTAAASIAAISAVAWGAFSQQQLNDANGEKDQLAASATATSFQLVGARMAATASDASTAELEETIETQNTVLDVAFQPDVQWAVLEGTEEAPQATGRCLWSRTQALGAFMASNLPRPADGMEYEFWLVYDEAWVNGGRIKVDAEGRGRLIMRRMWGGGERGPIRGYAVTLEPEAAAEQRTGKLVLQSPIE